MTKIWTPKKPAIIGANEIMLGSLVSKKRSVVGGGLISPTDISNLVLWLNAETGCMDFLSAPCDELTDQVLTWEDQSDGGNDFAADNPGVAPWFKPNAVNSLPSVDFRGSPQVMKRAAVLGAGEYTFTVFMVAKINSNQDDNGEVYSLLGSNGTYGNIEFMWAHSGRATYHDDCAFGVGVTTSSRIWEIGNNWMLNTYDNWTIFAFRMKGQGIGDIQAWKNGGNVMANLASGSATCGTGEHRMPYYHGAGGDDFAVVEIAEVIIYSDALSDVNRVLIEEYLSDRYDITL